MHSTSSLVPATRLHCDAIRGRAGSAGAVKSSGQEDSVLEEWSIAEDREPGLTELA